MPLVLANRVRETTTTTGTGAVSLGGAVSGFQGFNTAIGNTNTTYYTIVDAATSAWEVGLGTYTAAGSTLSRDTVFASSSGGALVPFAAGVKDVFVTQPSERAVYVLGAGTGLAAGAAAFTANAVPYANSTSTLATSANMTFNGTRLTVADLADSGLTSGRVVYASTGGSLVDSANLTFDGTSLTLGGNPTLSGGTANGVAYLNASKVLTTGAALQFDGSNLGLGVTPGTWAAAAKALDFTFPAYGMDSAGSAFMSFNARESSAGNWVYKTTDEASRFVANADGSFRFFTAPSGTAGNAITFTQAMTLDASGRLGVGTTSPDTRLHISGNDAQFHLEDPRTTGDGSHTVSIAAYKAGVGYDNLFYDAASHQFRVAGTERARITSGGDLLVGATTSSATSDDGVKLLPTGNVYITASSGNGIEYYNTSASAFRFYVTNAGTIFATNTTISAISDQRFKENIQDLDVGLGAIMALKPRKFDWKAGKGKDIKNDRGWIAQEFEQVFPDLIDEWRDPAPEGEEPYKSVRADLIPVLVKAIQEQQALIESLTARIAALEA